MAVILEVSELEPGSSYGAHVRVRIGRDTNDPPAVMVRHVRPMRGTTVDAIVRDHCRMSSELETLVQSAFDLGRAYEKKRTRKKR